MVSCSRNAARLAGIPAVLITGRLDISGPPDIAWELAQRWPGAELVIVDDAGHGVGSADDRGRDRRSGDQPLRTLTITATWATP